MIACGTTSSTHQNNIQYLSRLNPLCIFKTDSLLSGAAGSHDSRHGHFLFIWKCREYVLFRSRQKCNCATIPPKPLISSELRRRFRDSSVHSCVLSLDGNSLFQQSEPSLIHDCHVRACFDTRFSWVYVHAAKRCGSR